ncbi:MAG: LysM peptidoglycan-binding domain-containing protein [Anaerolineae bacterium]|nr:LysM peptidoglycan-binding domain-containing protein [Anaerolineae bacterium]NUQ02757.1 LysM peptidoglycan-binding domain-containing protein [Anaerolineae bacterium]
MTSFKICPICGTRAHRSAPVCATCGASLHDVPETSARASRPVVGAPQPDRRFGEIDLSENEVARRGGLFFVGLAILALALLAVLAFPLLQKVMTGIESPSTASPPPPSLTVAVETNTPLPAPVMATVTPPPPTPMPTSTPGPCLHVVVPGDDLISIIFNCGHRSLDVMPQVLDLNSLSSPELIQLGQEIQVPWPTPTPDGAAAARWVLAQDVAADGVTAEAASLGNNGVSGEQVFSTQTPFSLPTETLLPGIGFHIVQPDESMVSIAYQYRTNAETLSQLNPEIAFSQCDFGLDTGGPRCVVFLIAGQQIRVPAPTPTTTLSPTLSGSETPTPTYTPTFNAPSLISPPNRTFFLRNELITLRWIGTGILAEDEEYLVVVEDMTSGAVFKAQTRELSFILPGDWQSAAPEPHEYRWSIGVVRIAEPDDPQYVTDPRLFTWEGRVETS